jgi:hypothetical protein
MSRRPGARALAAAAVAVLLPLFALPLAAPPAAALNPGDWFVTGIQSVEDQTKVMNGSILVMAGAVLTVRNATIEFTLPIEGLYNITVHAGGTLIMEQCTVRSAVEGLHYNFLVSGRLEVRGCDISGLRGDSTLGGLEINSNQYTIENSTFHHNEYFGLVIRSGSGTVGNTTFDHHTVAIFVTPGATPLIENVTITNSTSFGIKISESSPTVRNLTVFNSPNFAVGATGGVLNIVGCRIVGGVVGIDMVAGGSGRVEDCQVIDAGTGVRVMDASLTISNLSVFGGALGVNSTRSAVEVTGSSFAATAVGLKATGPIEGVFGGSATGNSFEGSGLAFELYIPSFFAENNTYGPQVTHVRLFHRVALQILDPDGARAASAIVTVRAADGSESFFGVTDALGEVTSIFEEYRVLPNGTRQNMTPHGAVINYNGQLTTTTFNATKDDTIQIKLAAKVPETPVGISRDALFLLGALLAFAAGAGALAMVLRRLKAAKDRQEDIANRRRRRRGPRSGR